MFYMLAVQFSCSFVSDSLRPHGQQHARPPCPSPTPGAYSNSGWLYNFTFTPFTLKFILKIRFTDLPETFCPPR